MRAFSGHQEPFLASNASKQMSCFLRHTYRTTFGIQGSNETRSATRPDRFHPLDGINLNQFE